MENNEICWNNFIQFFIDEIRKTEEAMRNIIRDSDGERTSYYKNTLFPAIAKKMDLIYPQKEFMTVDAVFYKKVSEKAYEIPIVFIESENKIDDAIEYTELFKLMVLNAPLKILIVNFPNWQAQDDIMHYFTTNWLNFPVNDFVKLRRICGEIRFIVTDWTGSNEFLTFAYNEDGKVFGKDVLNI